MPVHSFVDDRRLLEQGLRNYWGYNSIGFFSADARYLAMGHMNEFKTMVKTLHSAGIEVILDVVYSHTAEGNHLGPTLCFRGIDNAAYYRLNPEHPRYYVDYTGCGNTLNMMHPRVLQLIMDSLSSSPEGVWEVVIDTALPPTPTLPLEGRGRGRGFGRGPLPTWETLSAAGSVPGPVPAEEMNDETAAPDALRG